MKPERSLEAALKKAKRVRLHGNFDLRSLKEVQKTWYDISDKFRDFDEALAVYIQRVAPRWLSIAEILNRLSNEELLKLKDIHPSADYLARYKLLTLTGKKPKAGDIFVDLDCGEGAVTVWSPTKPEKFNIWKRTPGPKRDFKHVNDLTEMYVCGKIEDLERFDPNRFIDQVISKLGK